MAQDRPAGDVEKVIGKDDRVDIADATHLPYSSICVMTTTWPDGTYELGTAFVWGKQTAFTAGHLLYSQTKGWAVAVRLVAGMIGKTKPFGNVDAPRSLLRVHTGWVKGDPTYDLGAVFLPEPLGRRTGWSDLGSIEPRVGDEIVVTGYPGDILLAQRMAHLQTARGRILGQEFGLFTHDADATGGQSGSPIWRASDVFPYVMVCGLHKGQIDPAPANVALMFAREHCDWILARVAEAECWPGSPPWRPNGEVVLAHAESVKDEPKPRQWAGIGPEGTRDVDPSLYAAEVAPIDFAELQAKRSKAEGAAEVSGTAKSASSAEAHFVVPAKGRHAVPLELKAGESLSGTARVALPSGTFTDITLTLKDPLGKEVDHAAWFIASSGEKDFKSERFAFAALADGTHSLELRERNGVSAVIAELKFKAG